MTIRSPNDCNRTAIVVGGTSGFGAAITEELRQRRFAVITVGRSADSPRGVRLHFSCDVGDLQAWDMTVGKILEATISAKVDVLIYTVGYARVFPFGHTPSEEWHRHLRLNLTYVAESFPYLETVLSENASIATTGSQWSFRHGWPDLIPYITAKHALATLTEEYAATFPQRRFRHYCVPTMATPGYDAVRQSVIENKGTLHTLSDKSRPADIGLISRVFVTDLLDSTVTHPVTREISAAGNLKPVGA